MFVKTDDQNNIITYPYSLDQYRDENRHRSLPRFLNNRYLAKNWVFPVYPADKPEHDAVAQFLVLKDTPYKDESGWKLGWHIKDKTAAQIQAEFVKYQAEYKQKINDARDSKIYQTIDVAVSETVTVPVDIRKDKPDIQNISGLTQSATLQMLNSDETPIIFRGADDVEYDLSPAQVVLLGKTVAKHYSTAYAKSWTMKNQLKAATTIAEIDQISTDFGK